MGSPNSQRMKINVVGELDKGAAELRGKLKELKAPNLNEKRKETLNKDIGTISIRMCGLIAQAIEKKAISADPLGMIVGKSVFGEVVDVHCRKWMAAQSPEDLANAQRLSVLSGKTGGLWTTVRMNFVNGATWVYNKAKQLMIVVIDGVKRAFKWAWDGITTIAKWVWAKMCAIWDWFAGFFRAKGDTANVKKVEELKTEAAVTVAPKDDGIPIVGFGTVITAEEVVLSESDIIHDANQMPASLAA